MNEDLTRRLLHRIEALERRLGIVETSEAGAAHSHSSYLNRDGSVALTADWDIGDGRKLSADTLAARDAAGLSLQDDGGNVGVFVADGGNVGIRVGSAPVELVMGMMPGYATEGIQRLTRSDGVATRYHDIKAKVSNAAASNYVILAIHNGTENTTVDVLTLLGNGNVGIGTTIAPADVLEAVGNLRLTGTNTVQLKPGTAGSLDVLDITTPTANKPIGLRLLPNGTAVKAQIEMWNDSDTANGGRINLSVDGDTLKFEPFVGGTGTPITKIVFSTGNVGIGVADPLGRIHADQSSTTGAIPVLILDQADLSEEFIEFTATVGTGNPIEAVGAKTLTTTHFLRVNITGVGYRYIPVGTIA